MLYDVCHVAYSYPIFIITYSRGPYIGTVSTHPYKMLNTTRAVFWRDMIHFPLCRKNKRMYVLSWGTVFALIRVLFWRFPLVASLFGKQKTKFRFRECIYISSLQSIYIYIHIYYINPHCATYHNLDCQNSIISQQLINSLHFYMQVDRSSACILLLTCDKWNTAIC